MSPDWSATPEPVPYGDLTDPQSLNLYSYVRDNPETHLDPQGHCFVGDCILAAVAIGAVVYSVYEAIRHVATAAKHAEEEQQKSFDCATGPAGCTEKQITAGRRATAKAYEEAGKTALKLIPLVPDANPVSVGGALIKGKVLKSEMKSIEKQEAAAKKKQHPNPTKTPKARPTPKPATPPACQGQGYGCY